MSGEADYLYGLPGDEYLQDDPAAVYEIWECDHDVEDPEERVPFAIEEWAALPLGSHLISKGFALNLLDELTERFAEDDVSEAAYLHIESACDEDDVKAAFESACDLLRSKLNGRSWRQASRLVGLRHVSWTEDGEPLLDGAPMYVKRSGS